MLDDIRKGIISTWQQCREKYTLPVAFIMFGIGLGGMIGAAFTFKVMDDKEKKE